MESTSVVRNMIQQGFSPIGKVLSDSDLQRLKQACDSLLTRDSISFAQFRRKRNSTGYETVVLRTPHTTVVTNTLGASPEIDAILESVYANTEVQRHLESVLGTGYKLWNVSIRRSDAGDPGLGLHQDTAGEMGFTILLDDEPDFEGSTVFWPGSHWFPLTIRELMVYPLVPFKALPKSKLRGAVGRAGEMFFFFNRTWHGRYPRKRQGPVTAILMSCMPVGSKYEVHIPPPEILDRLGPELRKRVSADSGVRMVDKSRCEVVADGKDGDWAPHPSLLPILTGKVKRPGVLSTWAGMTSTATRAIIAVRRKVLG